MSKKPFVTKEQVEEIVKTYPTPFHLYDEKGIRENAKALKEAFAWNPGYKEYFAVKATPNPFLLQILQEYGCGCDCSSYTELLMSDAVGIDGHDIMFSSNDTPGNTKFSGATRNRLRTIWIRTIPRQSTQISVQERFPPRKPKLLFMTMMQKSVLKLRTCSLLLTALYMVEAAISVPY